MGMNVFFKSMALSVFFISIMFWHNCSARYAPETWFGLINKTDLVVKGDVIWAKQVKSESGEVFIKLGLNIKSTILINDSLIGNDQFTDNDEFSGDDRQISIYLGRNINPINVGKQGYFFIHKRFDKWYVVDGDIGVWELVKIRTVDEHDDVIHPLAAPNGFEFAFEYLVHAPEILQQKLRYIDTAVSWDNIAEKMLFTEKGLLEYFNSEPCQFDKTTSDEINDNIKAYLSLEFKSEYSSNKNDEEYLSFKDIGSACVFNEVRQGNKESYWLLLIDKKTKLVIDQYSLENIEISEKQFRQKPYWKLYKLDSDSLE